MQWRQTTANTVVLGDSTMEYSGHIAYEWGWDGNEWTVIMCGHDDTLCGSNVCPNDPLRQWVAKCRIIAGSEVYPHDYTQGHTLIGKITYNGNLADSDNGWNSFHDHAYDVGWDYQAGNNLLLRHGDGTVKYRITITNSAGGAADSNDVDISR